MEKIRVGQIGTAHAHAAGKMEAYRNSPEFEVVGVVEPDPARKKSAQSSPAYRDLPFISREELLNIKGLKCVAVETEVKDLLDNAQACIDAGMHIHLDKPAGTSLAHFRRILDKAASKHVMLQMGYMFRYNPAVVFMREAIKRGWIGQPFEVHAVMSKVVDPATRIQLATYAGGIFFELGCHVTDLAVAVLGVPRRVLGFSQHASPQADKLADNTLVVLEYERALASLKSSAMEVEGFARRQFTVCGTEGTIHVQPLDAPHVTLSLSKPRDQHAAGVSRVEFGDYPRYVADVADMAKVVRMEKDFEFSYEHDFAVQKVVLEGSGAGLDS